MSSFRKLVLVKKASLLIGLKTDRAVLQIYTYMWINTCEWIKLCEIPIFKGKMEEKEHTKMMKWECGESEEGTGRGVP